MTGPLDPSQIDLTAIVNPWQALVLVVLIVCVLVVPQAGAWMQAKRSAVAVNEVKKTLTTNNGGSHVKDALDRIERVQAQHGAALADHVESDAKWKAQVEEILTARGR